MDQIEILELVVTGLVAGALGGLLGIGGSVVMIPVLTLLLDRSQHLAQASAMVVNIFVALPAAYGHHMARAVRWDVFVKVLPAGLIFIIVGVELSDLFEGDAERLLTSIFGLFLTYVILINLLRMWNRAPEPTAADERVTWTRCTTAGAITGLAAGLLGIGGGVLAVPLIQRMCHLPLRQCIATSSAVMMLTAIVGAIRKNYTLPTHLDAAGDPLLVSESLLIAGCLIPTAIIGGLVGSRLTHVLPLKWVRVAFIILVTIAAVRMLGLV